MKSIIAIVVIGLLLLVGSASASQVTNVEIRYQDGATVAQIDVKGPVRFTHETEVPKNGRPNRVILDILSASHELGAKEFLDLPPCLVTGVRTSQFAVTPEKIVRVVFDLAEEPLYRVDSRDGVITVWFENKGTRSFSTWSTRATVAATKVAAGPSPALKPAGDPKSVRSQAGTDHTARRNRAIESDRLASLEAGAKTDPDKAAEAPKAKATPTPVKPTDRSFAARKHSDKPAGAKSRSLKSEVTPAPSPVGPGKSTPTLASKGSDKKATPTPKPVTKPQAKKAVTAAEKPKPAAKKAAVAEKPKPAAKKATAIAQAPKPAAMTPAKVASKPKAPAKSANTEGQKSLAQKVTGKKPKTKKQSQPGAVAAKPSEPEPRATARFRRKAPSGKIRGTMVAEFPKRLVIKYKSGGRRDPFGSLIDNSQTYNNPVETRIPNVEGLKLVGIINADGETNRALFEDNAGFSYMLKGGDKVRNGYVLRVDQDQVYFQIFEYGWSRTVALTME